MHSKDGKINLALLGGRRNMKMSEAMSIIGGRKLGYMVSFEERKGGMLHSEHFPDKHAGEELIETEEEAWSLAKLFAKNTKGKMVNIYVINQDFSPTKNYKDQMIENR